ncbi:hypothetical protein KEM55_003104 [Ascosphaera atra]|nr:hypothetical protein KEM55_003104 [Ascosphaera atra]
MSWYRRASTTLPPTVLDALHLSHDPEKTTFHPLGGGGFTTTGRLVGTQLTSSDDDLETPTEKKRSFFIKLTGADPATVLSPDGESTMKVDKGEEMMLGEYTSLNAIAASVPGLCPRAISWGGVEQSKGKQWWLATEFLKLGGYGSDEQTSLAKRLGKLHSTPAPSAPRKKDGISGNVVNYAEGDDDDTVGDDTPQFGFPVPTYCGDTRQPNTFRRSWAKFFAEQRLLTILAESERRNGSDRELRHLIEQTAEVVVPRLLGDGHLGYDRHGKGSGIVPVVVHGDLWAGNASTGYIVGEDNEQGETGAVIYDSSACYAHSEFELGIMTMFGGFGREFYKEYHKIVPKTEPVEEYEDRVALYELYHQLNHHAIFAAGYKSGAVSTMKKLIRKYGQDKKGTK